MKKLIIINGTPGAGKTTVSKELNKVLDKSVWLDGDWCWMMNPFVVNDENKKMVESNIYHILNNFLGNSSFDYIIFNWVIHYDGLMEKIIKNLNIESVEIFKITLTCEESILRKRLEKQGRLSKNIEDSIKKQGSFFEMDTIKINTSYMSVYDITKYIGGIIEN